MRKLAFPAVIEVFVNQLYFQFLRDARFSFRKP
jgi:hypothetical protein